MSKLCSRNPCRQLVAKTSLRAAEPRLARTRRGPHSDGSRESTRAQGSAATGAQARRGGSRQLRTSASFPRTAARAGDRHCARREPRSRPRIRTTGSRVREEWTAPQAQVSRHVPLDPVADGEALGFACFRAPDRRADRFPLNRFVHSKPATVVVRCVGCSFLAWREYAQAGDRTASS